MPSIRIGFSTDFNLVGEQVGIGTTNPTARLEVAGQILADNVSGSGGITTFTTYDGFLQSIQGIGNTLSITETTKGNLNSLSGEIKIDGEITVGSATTITGGRLDSLSVTDKFDLPSGGTNERLNTAEKGSTRFNQDLGQLEFYTGLEWRTVGSIVDTGGRGRGVFGGGWDSGGAAMSEIAYLNIMSFGNSVSFGEFDSANNARSGIAPASSSTRGLFMGGGSPARRTDIDYITIASEGNGIDFGNLTETVGFCAGASSSTRGLRMGGASPANSDVVDYVEISTLGNAIDFGDLTEGSTSNGGLSSPTRAFAFGGNNPAKTSKIDFVTISSKGNAIRFGDMTWRNDNCRGNIQSSTRGVMGGGRDHDSTSVSHINYITMASEGNAEDFGDLTEARSAPAGASNQTRGIFYAGGASTPHTNIIEYVTIATTGDGVDFGDAAQPSNNTAGVSDSHGGLGGF